MLNNQDVSNFLPFSALHIAAASNKSSLIEKILQNERTDVNSKDANGKTSLEIVSGLAYDESFATLIAYGANATSQQCNEGDI